MYPVSTFWRFVVFVVIFLSFLFGLILYDIYIAPTEHQIFMTQSTEVVQVENSQQEVAVDADSTSGVAVEESDREKGDAIEIEVELNR